MKTMTAGRTYTTCYSLDIIRMLDDPEADFVTFLDTSKGAPCVLSGLGS